MTALKPERHKRRRSRTVRIIRAVLIGLGALIVIGVIAFLIWANTGIMQAETQPLQTVTSNPAVTVTQHDDAVVMAPKAHPSGVGLVFIPGAKVAPEAYLYKLSAAVEHDGLTVVITKPILNLAFFDPRPLSTFTDDTHGVTTWYVGGHSLGGVRACQYAQQPDVHGLILFGSYCANDLSVKTLSVLSISGSRDGLSTPQKIRQAAHLLPASTTFTQIAGANHASFGNYGPQPGDGTATISDARVRSILAAQLTQFLRTR